MAAIVKKDLSGVSLLCQKLNLEPKFMSILLAIACKRFDLLNKKYIKISNKLGIHNPKAVEILLKVLSGDVGMVCELIITQNTFFEPADPKLLECILTLINKVKTKPKASDIQEFLTEPDYHIMCELFCNYVVRKYGIAVDTNNKEEKSTEGDNTSLADKLKDLISASFGGPNSTERIKNIIVDNKAQLDPIWRNHPSKIKLIIAQKLREVFIGAETELKDLDAKFDKNVAKNMKYIKYLEDAENGSMFTSKNLISNDEYEVMKDDLEKLETEEHKVAYALGWVFSTTRYIPFYQKYYFCITWADNNEKEDKVIICMTCRLFCHEGHETVLANEGVKGLVVCSCGAGTFPFLKKRDDEIGFHSKYKKCKMLLESRKNCLNDEEEKLGTRTFLLSPFYNTKRKKKLSIAGSQLSSPHALSRQGSRDSINQSLNKSHHDLNKDKIRKLKGSKAPKKFQDEIAEYKNSEFIDDLVIAFKLEQIEIKEDCMRISEQDFKVFDESLNRKVHMFEHVILVAHGCWRQGLLKLLWNTEPLNEVIDRLSLPYCSGYNAVYDTMATFVSAYQNNIRTFTRYNERLLNAVGLKTTKGYHFKDKAKDIYLLIKGDPIFKGKDRYTDSFNRYMEIFNKLFGKEYMKALCLHKFSTLSENEIVELINIEESSTKQHKQDILSSLHQLLIEQFLGTDLQCGEDAAKWIETFIQVSLGDLEGYKYICKQYEILNSKAVIFKAICSQEIDDMSPLFKAWKGFIDDDLSYQLSNILNEKILKLEYNKSCNVHIIQQIQRIQNFFENKKRDVHTFEEIFVNARIDKDMANVLFGFTALLNKEHDNIVNIFKHKKHKFEDLGIFKSIIRLATTNKLEEADFQEAFHWVLERVLQKSTKSRYKDVPAKIEDLSESEGLFLLQHLLKAAHGDIFSLARFANYTSFHNKSTIWSVLTSLSTDTPFAQNIEGGNFEQLRFQMRGFFIYLFRFLTKNDKEENASYVADLFDKYSLDYFILRLLFKPNLSLENLLNEIEFQSKWKDKHLFEIVKIIAEIATNTNNIPDLDAFFEYIHKHTDILEDAELDGDDVFSFVIPNRRFKTEEVTKSIHDVFEKVKMENSNKNVSEFGKFKAVEERYAAGFKYKIDDDSIRVNIPSFFKTILEAGYGKENSACAIVELLIPIFREIPCATEILSLCLQIVRGNK